MRAKVPTQHPIASRWLELLRSVYPRLLRNPTDLGHGTETLTLPRALPLPPGANRPHAPSLRGQGQGGNGIRGVWGGGRWSFQAQLEPHGIGSRG